MEVIVIPVVVVHGEVVVGVVEVLQLQFKCPFHDLR